MRHSIRIAVGPVQFRIGSDWSEPIAALEQLYAGYPQDEARAAQESARAKAAEVALQRPAAAEDLNFGYRIEGGRPAWRTGPPTS